MVLAVGGAGLAARHLDDLGSRLRSAFGALDEPAQEAIKRVGESSGKALLEGDTGSRR
jgi:hypothetical protein